jgi:thioredoxin reductase/predicted O-methyltransferase YrrM
MSEHQPDHGHEHQHEHGHDHRPKTIERHCDVAIVGASAAGLAAGLQLGRQRRSVIVVDSREPRNAPASHMHSYLGHEGIAPSELAAIGREEVRSYGGEVIQGRATGISRVDSSHDDTGRFRVELVGGHSLIARHVLVATGLVDELPDIEGLAQHWGRDVIHCPFCHGYEVRDQRLVQIVTHPMALHPASLFRQLTTQLTLVLHEGVSADDPQLNVLRAGGVAVVDQRIARIVTGADGHIAEVELANGDRIAADAVAIGARFRVRAELLAPLGIFPTQHPTGLGDFIETNTAGETSVPGLYVAGNLTDPSQQVLQAAAQGSWVAGMISFSLARHDLEAAARPSANEADWDHRYSGDQMWSGNPNGTLVREITGMTPGRALDVGAGEGGDAVWLAEQGWRVTANDISPRGLDRVAAVAAERQLSIECHHGDANALNAFTPAGSIGTYDLVSAHYASIPRTPDGRGVANLLNAVAPGGTLLVVSHDITPMRAPVDTTQHSRPFDADAYQRVEDFVAALTDSPGWTIEVNESRERPPGSATHQHHVDDIVLRARRTSRDSGPRDSGPRDSGPRDSGPRDSGPRDSGPRDSGPRDSGPIALA